MKNTIEDGLVLKGTRIVFPKGKHKQALAMIHENHLGLGKCKLQCKDTVYWPVPVPEILKSKKQTSSKHGSRTRGSNTPMDKGCD